jgi:hypothetical protein
VLHGSTEFTAKSSFFESDKGTLRLISYYWKNMIEFLEDPTNSMVRTAFPVLNPVQ